MSREISGPEFRRAVRRSGLGNQGVADLLGVGLTALDEYMRLGVRPKRIEQVLVDMAAWLDDNPLAAFSDIALLAEVGRRMDAGATARARPDSDMAKSGQDDHGSDSSAAPEVKPVKTSPRTRGGRTAVGTRRGGVASKTKGTERDPGEQKDS